MMAAVIRNGEAVGLMDCERASLDSQDRELMALWERWKTEGFAVLGPGVEPAPRSAACAVAVHVIRPKPSVAGLIAIELENNGYVVELLQEHRV